MEYKRNRNSRFKGIAVQDTFKEIYDTNLWKSENSASGTGSDLVQTEVIRRYFPEVVKKYKIKTLLDIPCGDFNWLKFVDLKGVQYLGGDIVGDLIENNNRQYASDEVVFEVLNLLEDKLPKVDLIFSRDCLVHFSYAHIAQAIKNIKESGSKYLLTTSFIRRKLNFDIVTGDWRPINLQRKPFNFPEPIEVVLEKCMEGNGKSYDKSLLLYNISDLPDKLG